ncbi:MAG: hypothetical protein EPO24_11165 [Bacteroidetes bacterium]|nr:MAG: hypothetical protein EPO24_11165 [Bacteroidota bacterium]
MKFHCIHFAVIIILVVLFISCSSDDDSPSAPGPVTPSSYIIPLKVGNSWTYLAKRLLRTGAVAESAYVVITILKDTAVQGVTWYIDNSGSWHANRNDGYWTREFSDPNHSNDFLIYKYPAGLNEVYQIAANVTGKLASLTDTVNVPQGEHVCYRYELYQRPPYGNKLIAHEYIKPDVGLIRQHDYAPEGFLEFVFVLTSYNLN